MKSLTITPRQMARSSRRIHPLLGFVLGLALMLSPAWPAQKEKPPEERDKAAKRSDRFVEPLLSVEEEAIDENETRDLEAIVEGARRKVSQAPIEDKTKVIATARTEEIAALESFVLSHPASSWTPSLQANLGKYHRQRGRYTLALGHWEAAWEATRHYRSGQGKMVADFVLAHWTRLLASLGRYETLESIFGQNRGRVLDDGPLAQMWVRNREAFGQMQRHPGVSYQCGIFALDAVARQGRLPYDAAALQSVPSPPAGFTMKALDELSGQLKLGLVAVKREQGQELIVPSVIHWRENHYAAIVRQRGDLYQVADPTFEDPQFLSAEAINAEASGNFLIPGSELKGGWRRLSAAEAEKIHGRGNPNFMADANDQICRTDCPTGCAPGTGMAVSYGEVPCEGCGAEAQVEPGMPGWSVSEPYINLWLRDEPLGYQPAKGSRISLDLSCKQREESAAPGDIFGFSMSWQCSWLSYLETVGNTPATVAVHLHLPGGGLSYFAFTNGEATNYYNNLRLRVLTSGSTVTGYELLHPDGSKSVYAFLRTSPSGIWSQVFMSKQIDPQGRETQFRYPNYDPNNSFVRLEEIIDPDSRTTRLYYETNFVYSHNLVTRVVDPFGRTARFTYLDYMGIGRLQQIEDVAGLKSQLTYGANGWPSALTTPYGTTTFDHIGYEVGRLEDIDRHLIITVPGGGRHIYAYAQYCTSQPIYLPPAYPDADVPQGTPVGTLDNGPGSRNSFYWGPRQSAGLPPSVYDFTTAHYLKARMRHWLSGKDEFGLRKSVDSLSIERAPSPDAAGTIEGQKTWYDYAGKPPGQPALSGSQNLPSLIARRLPDGSTWYEYYQRDGWGRTLSITRTYGSGSATRTVTYSYAPNGIDLVEERGPDGLVVRSSTYNSFHQVLSASEVADAQTTYITTYAYDPTTRQLTSVARPNGVTTTLSYNSDGRLWQTSDQPAGQVNSYTYWANGLPYQHTDPRGLTRTFYWDNLQRPVQISFPDASYIIHTYNRLDRAITRDRMSQVTYFNYNALRQLTSVVDALGRTTSYTYCACGALESIINPLSQTTRFLYDNGGNRTSVVYPDNSTENFEYNLPGQLTRTKDHTGNTIATYSFNNQGRLVSAGNPSGQLLFSVGYDINDRPISSSSAGGPSTTQAFDRLGRLISRTVSGGGTESFVYSARGLVSYTDPLGRLARYEYDLPNRQITFTNPRSEVSQMTFSPAGDPVRLTDAKGQSTVWSYDNEGRMTSKSDSSGMILNLLYDGNGRLVYRSSAAKGITYYYYDRLDNLTNSTSPGGSSFSYGYDALNRMASMSDSNTGTTSFGYTSFGALQSEDGPWASDGLTYTYDQNHRRAGLSLAQPSGTDWSQSYGYDTAWRLQNVGSPAGAFTYSYQGASPLVSTLGLPGGATVVNTYDGLARLTETTLRNGGSASLNTHGYTYNNIHQRTRQSRGNNYVDYTYDNTGQLLSAFGYETAGGTPRWHERLSYAYDPAGNLTRRDNNALAQTFALGNSLNQITGATSSGSMTVAGMTANGATSVSVNGQGANLYSDGSFASVNQPISGSFSATAQGGGGSATDTLSVSYPGTAYFSYDSNGNLLGDGQRSFSYDEENQLVQVIVSGVGQVTFGYDGLRRRRWKREYDSAGSFQREVHYIYDGNRVIQERVQNNQVLVTYTRGLDQSGSLEGAGGIGGLLGRTDSNGSAFYHTDGGGNVTALVNASQQVVARYLYDSFGSLIGSSGPLAEANLYRFSSKEYQTTSGLYYYGLRYYEPNLQRWLNRDPIGEDGGINLYGFVGNNPISLIDPYGLEIGFWEGLIPVWGSGMQACEDFEAGRWGWGTFNTAVAVSDVIPIRAAAGAVSKGVWKCGSHTWSATSKWLTKCSWREFKGQEMHHTFIPRNDWGKNVPDWLKNQPWNLMPMKNQVFHDAVHGVGDAPFNLGQRLWYGMPTWFNAGAFSMGGKEANWLGNGGGASFSPSLVPRPSVGSSLSSSVPAPLPQ